MRRACVGRDLRAAGDRLTRDLADRPARDPCRRPGVMAAESSDLDRDLVGPDAGRQRDVGRGHDDRTGGRRRRRPCRRCVLPCKVSRIPTKATIARKTPTSKTSRFERFKLVLPRRDGVTGGTTLAPPKSRRDYTKGLGPLGRNGRKSCTLQGRLQGCGRGRRVPAVLVRGAPESAMAAGPMVRRPRPSGLRPQVLRCDRVEVLPTLLSSC